MTDGHLSDKELIIYADAPESLTGLEAIDAHLDDCGQCWAQVEEYRTIAAEVLKPQVWALSGDRGEDVEHAGEDVENAGEDVEETAEQAALRDYQERLRREDADAERLLTSILATPFRFHVAKLVRRQWLRTGGVVRLLCRRAHAEVDNEPLFALNLAEAAVVFAERLPDDYYPAEVVYDLRGTAWKEYATACRYLARFRDALAALTRAERAYRHLLAPTISVGTVELARAGILWRMEQYDEALRSVRSSSELFVTAGDTLRYLSSKEVEAVILHRMGAFEAARAAYVTLYEGGNNVGDADMVARAAQNLGTLFVERGDVGQASLYFLEALQLTEGLKLKARAARARWCIGWVALVAGDYSGAEKRLRASEGEIAALGMVDDVDKVKLHLAEALLMQERFAEVESLAAGLVSRFSDAGLVTGALTAAAFLREAAAARTLTRRQVRHVREYLTQVRENPALLFVPAPPYE
jgi:tetratricopeptide (TPR) repeat protein